MARYRANIAGDGASNFGESVFPLPNYLEFLEIYMILKPRRTVDLTDAVDPVPRAGAQQGIWLQ